MDDKFFRHWWRRAMSGPAARTIVVGETWPASSKKPGGPTVDLAMLRKDPNVSHPNEKTTSFRPDIQGMRAVAVSSVVLFHAGISGFSGGFLGVDIFFVISGFLIVGLLIDEADRTGCIDVLHFWSKRARRLIPNATLTLCSTVLLVAILFPGNLKAHLGWDFASAATYWSNYHFSAKAVDYFLMDDIPSPVLHFWSLNVEEQC